MTSLPFDLTFHQLTDHPPFPWQRSLYERFVAGDIPKSCNLPTGLGKTSVIAIWLIALANHTDKLPRRLVYVVNRRTVVDQTTAEVVKYCRNLRAAGLWEPLVRMSAVQPAEEEFPLAISTLRGQYADKRKWSADPSRPAVICGTVDMIGSRLLFSGYGVGFKAKPLHAGFLAQDALVVHDEAHLEPAFQELVLAIEKEQKRCKEFGTFRVMELTATSRAEGIPFGLTSADQANSTIQQRIGAKKMLRLHALKDAKKVAEQIADLALQFKDSGQAILVYVRTVEDVLKIRDRLHKEKLLAEPLTGTLRGKERDDFVTTPIFQRFLPQPATPDGTVFLVCTSAGEVGVNISADHLVCDLSTFESMAQRFGRVNRFGLHNATEIHVVHPTKFEEDDYEQSRASTLELLGRLKNNASPAALGELPARDRQAAFAPTPTILPVTDILFDAWVLTTIRDTLPGRPKVEPYLHGIRAGEPPETHVAWREEVERLQPKYENDEDSKESETEDRKALAKLASELLDDYPLQPRELLREPSYRAFKHFEVMAKRCPKLPVWLLDDDGKVHVLTVAELADKDEKARIEGVTVIFPPSAGGLDGGMLSGTTPVPDEPSLDIADTEERVRVDSRNHPDAAGMRLIRAVKLPTDYPDSEPELWFWYKYGNEGDTSAKDAVEWCVHVSDVERHTAEIVDRLALPNGIAEAVKLAAKFHDHGKIRKLFQTILGNTQYPEVRLAKSGKKGGKVTEKYRHEFGSLLDVSDPKKEFHAELSQLSPEMQDLVLHLIAAHHGLARPHFSADEAFDPERPQSEAEAMAASVPRRFARLQREYGRWGLAYLESLLRAADWAASANPSAFLEGDQ